MYSGGENPKRGGPPITPPPRYLPPITMIILILSHINLFLFSHCLAMNIFKSLQDN